MLSEVLRSFHLRSEIF